MSPPRISAGGCVCSEQLGLLLLAAVLLKLRPGTVLVFLLLTHPSVHCPVPAHGPPPLAQHQDEHRTLPSSQIWRLGAQGVSQCCHPEWKYSSSSTSAGCCAWPPTSRASYSASNKEGNTYMGAEPLRRVPAGDPCRIHSHCHIILHPHGLGLTSVKLP